MYYTGNRSVTLATNWIFDHPELDLETPLEEELQRLEAEEAEDDDDALDEEDEEESDEEEMMIRQHHMFHHHHHQTNGHYVHHQQQHNHHHHCLHDDDDDEDEVEAINGGGAASKAEIYYDVSDETDSDSDDFDEDDIPEFKMVFVVNTSLEMDPGKTAAQVGHAALGVQRVLTAKAGQNKYKVSTADIGLWQDFG